jgi:hypothetical protein
VPQPVRRALGLRQRDRIRCSFRAYGSKTDAYRSFQTMLVSGHPPDD